MYCTKCGTENEEVSIFCQSCGKSLSTESNTELVPPKTWLLESILVTLFCCLPFGIAGIIYASKIETHFYAGRKNEAYRYSEGAKKWVIASFITGIVFAIIYIGILMFMMINDIPFY